MGYDMQWKDGGGDAGYFRLNIWGMGEMRQVMAAAGIFDEDHGFPKWPRGEAPDEETEPEAYAAYQEKCNAVRAMRATDPTLVPVYKFCSNDGWLVVPEECKTIASRLRNALKSNEMKLDDEMTKLVEEFAEYNARAAEHGGYEVW